MAIKLVCPLCDQVLRAPEHLAGRRMTCPSCGNRVRIPSPEDLAVAAPDDLASLKEEAAPTSLATRLGTTALFLGLLSVIILCVPYVGYAAIGMSGVGLVLGLLGLVISRQEAQWSGFSPARAEAEQPLFAGAGALNFPLVGAAACLLALALTLLPFLFD